MTPEQWNAASDPAPMLAFLRDTGTSSRKLRLFACACVRRVWHSIDWKSQKVIAIAERYADGLVGDEELRSAALTIGPMRAVHTVRKFTGRCAVRAAADCSAAHAAEVAARDSARVVTLTSSEEPPALLAESYEERAAQADLLRHIINPFLGKPPSFPAHGVALAAALYDGDDSAREPLHDALLDMGRVDCAEHFREPEHPKGCWRLDVILGKG